MAKKEELMSGFGQRIKDGSPAVRKEATPQSAPEQKRDQRVGRKPAWDNTPRLTESYAYTSLALNSTLYEKARQIATRNNLPYRDIVNAALAKYIELYEARHGEIIPSRESCISAESLI